MIPVTPIAGLTILLDVDAIESTESTPETVVVLVDGQRMVVRESQEELARRISRCRAARLARAAHPARGPRGTVAPLDDGQVGS